MKFEKFDPEISEAIQGELGREEGTLNLIASENYASKNVLTAQGSLLQNKYAEGYPHRRYYGGCTFMDKVEEVAIERAKKLFNAEHANVQALSGVPSNMAAFFSLANFGDKIMGLALPHGGHLSHGHNVSFSGRWFKVVRYQVQQDTEVLDYSVVQKLAEAERPKIIIAGASAYPRTLHFDKFREIADKVGAHFVTDIAHIAGIVAAGMHPSPVPYADIVTTTTHKTLRGPRSALILCKSKWAPEVDKWVFPGIHGGPHMHTVAAKAVCFKEALQPEYKTYIKQILKNAKTMEIELKKLGYRLVADGTDTHLLLVDLRNKKITGKDAEEVLGRANIVLNRNTIPYDPENPFITSGIRIGTPAVTTRGMKETEIKKICEWIDSVLTNPKDENIINKVNAETKELCKSFPVYAD